MVEVAAFDALAQRAGHEPETSAPAGIALAVDVTATHRLEDVAAAWQALTGGAIESPGQSLAFLRLWLEALAIPASDQLYVVARLDGRPLALLPLRRRQRYGIRLYSWFFGTHVGCNAPLVDAARLAALTADERRALWQAMTAKIPHADLVYLPAVPERSEDCDGLFAELGEAHPVETLYRASFSSWEEANTTQRSKSRRKHDRQQGERLEALGQVSFEVVEPGEAAPAVLDIMFDQRRKRFAAMGIPDPFAPCGIARFYHATVQPESPLPVKLHVLRLDGEIVAVRYNVVHGKRLFCLISSMSEDMAIQAGSPGKQCLLRVMQTVFDEGFAVFDMGAGLTDEKRHWCNEQIALANHYLPLTRRGRVIVAAHATWRRTRARIKANSRLLRIAKALRGRLTRQPTPCES